METGRLAWAAAGICCLLLSGCAGGAPAPEARPALFSWSEEALTPEGRAALFRDMEALGLEALYQAIPEEAGGEAVDTFLTQAGEAGIQVWLLTGDPAWGLDPTGAAMAAEIARAAGYNRGLEAGERLRGVVMDVETYLTGAWADDPAEVMDRYVSAMAAARSAAGRAGLALSACVPYYYDDLGLAGPLERLVDQGCDGLVVMNYYRGDEAAQIETELALARAGGKPLTVAYELQPPGVHGLTEQNTYYGAGLGAVEESFDAIARRLGGEGLSYALHSYDALREVLADERDE